MIAVLDANIILNLLGSNLDESYFRFLSKTFEKVVITPFVFEEIKSNILKNYNSSLRDEVNNLIYSVVSNFVCYENYNEAFQFTSKITKYLYTNDENGEFHSIAYALEESRSGKTELMENLLKTHFISDDSPARNTFSEFYKTSLIGSLLDSIDLMTLFCLKGLISERDLLKYCFNLKLFYNKEASLLMYKIKDIKDKENLTLQEEQLLTEINIQLEDLSDSSFSKISDLIENSKFRSFFSEHKTLKASIKDVLNSNYREKIPEINQKIKKLTSIYALG